MDDMYQQYLEAAKGKNDAELALWIAGWKSGSEARIAGEFEIQRRRDQKQQEREKAISRRAWTAIVISIASLIVSILTVVFRK